MRTKGFTRAAARLSDADQIIDSIPVRALEVKGHLGVHLGGFYVHVEAQEVHFAGFWAYLELGRPCGGPLEVHLGSVEAHLGALGLSLELGRPWWGSLEQQRFGRACLYCTHVSFCEADVYRVFKCWRQLLPSEDHFGQS